MAALSQFRVLAPGPFDPRGSRADVSGRNLSELAAGTNERETGLEEGDRLEIE